MHTTRQLNSSSPCRVIRNPAHHVHARSCAPCCASPCGSWSCRCASSSSRSAWCCGCSSSASGSRSAEVPAATPPPPPPPRREREGRPTRADEPLNRVLLLTRAAAASAAYRDMRTPPEGGASELCKYRPRRPSKKEMPMRFPKENECPGRNFFERLEMEAGGSVWRPCPEMTQRRNPSFLIGHLFGRKFVPG